MDADPLGPSRPEERDEKPKPAENQDDGYETSNSGEAARRKPSSAEASPAPAPPPPSSPPPAAPPYEPLMRYQDPEPEPEPEPEAEYRGFEPPPPQLPPGPHQEYQHSHAHSHSHSHFPFPKYNEPYHLKRDPAADLPFDMTHHTQHPLTHLQHHHPHHQVLAPHMSHHEYGGGGGGGGVKRECEDPYSFVEEDPMCGMMQAHHHQPPPPPHQVQHHPHMMHHQMLVTQPKKRGRKKKIKDENGMELKLEPGMEGAGGLAPRPVKERKKHDRFNGMSEEEVSRRTLPDHLAENLDIIIIGINPGLFAAYKGHHYAGPGNHFWKCLYLSGLTREQMSADEDYKLLNFGIGFTNMVGRATKGSADLTRREIKEGSAVLLDKLQSCRPKVAVFNGKLIYEVFSGKKDFCFGKQPDTIPGTNTYMWVMPSSSARCAQLPRAADKVPFYAALKKFRDYLNGLVPHVDEAELVFPDNTSRRPQEEMEIRRLTTEPEPGDTMLLEDGTEVPLKKKRGRPKKVKLENGEVAPPTPRAPRQPRQTPVLDPASDLAGGPPKKKRGRPKKIRPEEQAFLLQQQHHQQQQQQQAASAMLPALPPMQPLPHEQGYLPPAGAGALGGGAGGAAGGATDFPQQLSDSLMYHQQMNDNATYFQPQQTNPGMESPLDVAHLALTRGYAESPGGASGGYAGSPHGVYASPRSQGYSPSPARTPQPQFPASPAAFSAPSPPLRGGGGGAGGAGGYGSPAAGGGGGGGGRTFAARSPLYAHSPASYHHAQASPARYSQSPHAHHQHPYARSPAPAPAQMDQQVARPYSRSPGVGGYPSAGGSPGGAGCGTPYSHHSSPAPPRTPSYSESHLHMQGGSSNASSAGSGLCADLSSDIGAAISSPPPPADFEPPARSPPLHHEGGTPDLPDYSKSSVGSSLSPGGGGYGAGAGGGLFETEGRLQFPGGTPPSDLHDHYSQDGSSGAGGGGGGGAGGGALAHSPRLDQVHQHMYPANYNRSTPEGVGVGVGVGEPFSPGGAFRTHTPHQPSPHPHYDAVAGSPGDYGGGGAGGGGAGAGGQGKVKSQDVASKSLSGLESLVDQIPSIAEGPGAGAGVQGGAADGAAPPPPPALPEYAPALYGPYTPYSGTPYSNNGYGSPFVGYGGGWVGGTAVMRPAPGYLSPAEWQYAAAAGYPAVAPAYHSAYNPPYYSHPPPAHHQQYLSAAPLLELHKNGEQAVPAVPSVPSVGFGGYC